MPPPTLPSTNHDLESSSSSSSASPSSRRPLAQVGNAIAAPFRYVNSKFDRLWKRCDKVENRPFVVVYQTLTCNFVNPLLLVVPIAFYVSWFAHPSDALTFSLHFIGIIPLAAVLSFATEELAKHAGNAFGGLINATFGNAVELVISIVALKEGQIRIVQASMLGSVLSNILLVLGCCFTAAGIARKEPAFNPTVAGTMASLMTVACVSLIIPAGLATVLSPDDSDGSLPKKALESILFLSRGSSVLLLLLYGAYLWFMFKSHFYLFAPEGAHKAEEGKANALDCNCKCTCKCNPTEPANGGAVGSSAAGPQTVTESGEPSSGSNTTATTAVTNNNETDRSTVKADDDDDEHEPVLGTWESMLVLLVVTLIIARSADYLVDAIDGVVEGGYMTKTFIGLILLPIVGNAAEHASSCIVAYKGNMELALQIAVGSSIQIAIFVTPFLVLLGAGIGQPMSLHFHVFETVVFFISVIVVSFLIQDGKTNYLEGIMCLGTYIIIGLAFWVYPDDSASPDPAAALPPLSVF